MNIYPVKRTEININDNEYISIRKVISELSRDSDIMKRDYRLVWISHGCINSIPRSILRSKISRLCYFTEQGRRIHPPPWLVDGVMAFKSYPGIPEID